MKRIYLSAFLILVCLFANAQCRPKICLIDYNYHDDSSPNADMTAIKAALPDILIDNSPGGYWGGGCLPPQYTALGIEVYSYITSGYEGTAYGTSEDDLTSNLARVDAIALDGATGVFLDEVSNYPNAASKSYITSIYNQCQTNGLKLILNCGLSNFDSWLMGKGDFLMSDEVYDGTRSPTVSESPYANRLLVVAQGITSAANAATISQGAQSNGFGYSYACLSYTSLPSWLGNYMALITQTPPASPIVGTITQTSCTLATGSVVLNGLPASGTWTLTRTPGGTTSTGTGTSSTVSGIAPGTYTYTVTNSAGCISIASNNVVINAQPSPTTAPTVGPITQPTCTVSTGSVFLFDLPATGTWTLTGTPGGAISSGTGTGSTITGLANGTYTFTVTNDSGCISFASGSIVISPQPTPPLAPTIGPITQPTCNVTTGGVFLYGLPASGTWTLTLSPGSTTSTGTGTSSTITGLATGTYTYIVTNADGCTSIASGNVVINAQPIPITPIITQNGNILYSDAANGNQWYNQNGLINSATSQNYTPSINGDYYVIVTLLGCSSDTSNSIVFLLNNGIELVKNNKTIRVYPNPVSVNDIVTFQINNTENEDTKLNIYNVIGVLVKSEILKQNQEQISIGDLSNGIYILEFKSQKWLQKQKLIIQR